MLAAHGLRDYLSRIGNPPVGGPTQATLAAVHFAHATHIPFENLDIHLGRGIRIDLDAVVAKLVGDRRGGYCFEHNTLLGAALESLGFMVERRAARVLLGGRTVDEAPLTHMALVVEADGEQWLVDAGFGGAGPLGPVPLTGDGGATFGAWAYRVEEVDGSAVLQMQQTDGWMSLYALDDRRPTAADLDLMNWWTSTHPTSGFVRFITVQWPGLDVQVVLRGVELTEYRPGEVTSTTLEPTDVLHVIGDRFGLAFPSGTTFVAPAPSVG